MYINIINQVQYLLKQDLTITRLHIQFNALTCRIYCVYAHIYIYIYNTAPRMRLIINERSSDIR